MSLRSWLRGNRLLVLLWICFVLRGAFYSLLFPVWEGYDEYPHFAFIQYLVSNQSLPAADTPVSREVEESLKLLPLPWMLQDLKLPHAVHDDYWRLPEAERIRRQGEVAMLSRELARQPAMAELPNWEAQQPPLYYWLLSFPLRLAWEASLPARVILLRLLSILLASLVVPLGFVVARRVLASPRAAIGVVALVCLLPELMVDIARVGNESLSVVVYTLLLLGAVKHIEEPERAAGVLLAGASLGLGLITKAYFLTAVPAIILLFAYTLWKAAGRRRRELLLGVLSLGLALLISGWWYWRNKVQTGSWSGVMPDVLLGEMPVWQVLRQIPQVDWANALDAVFLSHVWFGNWSFLQVRSWMYHAFRSMTLLSLAGLVLLFVLPLFGRGGPSGILRSRRNLGILAGIYGFFWIGILYHVLLTFVAQGVSASQGWYLYGLVVAEVLIFAAGLLAVCPRSIRRWALPAAALAFGALDLYTVHFLFIPYYTGLIAHQANGVLATLHVGQLATVDWWALAGRLAVNKSWIGAPAFVSIWLLYVVATAGLVAAGFAVARRN